MDENEILSKVKQSLQAALKLSDQQAGAIDLSSTAAAFPGWTSMAHLEFVLAVERECDVTFDADEFADLASVAAIVAAVQRART